MFRKNKESDKKAKEILVSSLVNNMTLSEVVDLAIKTSEDKANKVIKKMKGSEIQALIEGNNSVKSRAPSSKKSPWDKVKTLFDSAENYIKKIFGLNIESKKLSAPTKKKPSTHRFQRNASKKEVKSPEKKKASTHAFKKGKPKILEDKSPKKPKVKSKEKPENKKKP